MLICSAVALLGFASGAWGQAADPLVVETVPGAIPVGMQCPLMIQVDCSIPAFSITHCEVRLDGVPMPATLIGARLLAIEVMPSHEGSHSLAVTYAGNEAARVIEVRDFQAADDRERFLAELVDGVDALQHCGAITASAASVIRNDMLAAGHALWSRIPQATRHLDLAVLHANQLFPAALNASFAPFLDIARNLVLLPFSRDFLLSIEDAKALLVCNFFEAHLALDANGNVIYTATKHDAIALGMLLRGHSNGVTAGVNKIEKVLSVGGRDVKIVVAIGRGGRRAGQGTDLDGADAEAPGGDVNFAVGGDGAKGSAGVGGGNGGDARAGGAVGGGAVNIAVAGNGGKGGAGAGGEMGGGPLPFRPTVESVCVRLAQVGLVGTGPRKVSGVERAGMVGSRRSLGMACPRVETGDPAEWGARKVGAVEVAGMVATPK